MAMSRTSKIVLIITGVVLTLILSAVLGIALLYSSIKGDSASVKDNSVLVLKVAGEMPEYTSEDSMAQLFGGTTNSLTSLTTQLRKAKVDKRITGVMLHLTPSGLGWAQAEDLRDVVADFKTSGKPIYAYMEFGTNKEYYIATACDKIYMPPTGDLYVNGLAANMMFYKGALDKVGVEFEFIKIGKYKNAPDQYLLKEPSPEQSEVTNEILDGLYNRLVASTAEARKKSPEEVKTLIDNAPFNAVQAKASGLIDDALYADEVNNQFKARLGYKENDQLPTISWSNYREIPADSLGLNNGDQIAVIFASGAITTGKSTDSAFGSATTGSDTVAKAIKDAGEDENIKAIVLRVNSPGGSALASDIIWHAVEVAKKKKPVVASMSDYAASGGYYISCNANKIVAQPSTLTGSIGVFVGKPSMKGLYDWAGVSNEYVLRGKNAGIFRESEKFSESEKAKIQEQANSIYYENFVPKVAKGRNRTNDEINAVGQGRVWLGALARERGLVDEIGGLEKAVEVAKQLANIDAKNQVRRVVYPAPRPFLSSYFDKEDSQIKQQKIFAESLPEEMRRVFGFVALFDSFQRGEVMAMLPYQIEIK